MKKAFVLFAILSIFALISSCGGKAKQTESSEVEKVEIEEKILGIHFSETIFDDNWNKLSASQVISKADYDRLKLSSLSFMDSYEDLQYEIGKELIDEGNKKLLTVKTVSSGEIAEYLLGYIDNQMTDSLLVAYEDAVEYYSKTSSIIKDNQVVVTTINFDYSMDEEVSDTIITTYFITPELQFEEIIEE